MRTEHLLNEITDDLSEYLVESTLQLVILSNEEKFEEANDIKMAQKSTIEVAAYVYSLHTNLNEEYWLNYFNTQQQEVYEKITAKLK